MELRQRRHQVARGTRPDAESPTELLLSKPVSELRATYQIRLLTFRAVREGKKLGLFRPQPQRFAAAMAARPRASRLGALVRWSVLRYLLPEEAAYGAPHKLRGSGLAAGHLRSSRLPVCHHAGAQRGVPPTRKQPVRFGGIADRGTHLRLGDSACRRPHNLEELLTRGRNAPTGEDSRAL